ncbi:MAG: hybrid sensor histidine kinase/response regulator, partial [Nitrospina sp.]|nr:hybrid sensor histidine kinase/response regulator [Nitrospina sp.]
YSISMAPSGEMALKIAPKIKPDLILMDVMMPGMDGFETCRKLKENPVFENTPILFVTGKTETVDIVEAFKSGGADYITKPFRSEEVLARIETHLCLTKTIKKNKSLVEDLKEAILNLESAQQESLAKSQFLGRMSHELHTPLNAIIGFSQLLDMETENPLNESQSENIAEINKAGRHLLNLVGQVLEINRIDSGELKCVPQKVSLSAIIDDAVTSMSDLAKAKCVSFDNLIDKNSDIFVSADPDKIQQIFLNLLDNAVKYNKKGGKVTLSLVEGGPEKVCVAIRDTGDGIPEDNYEKIFDPLYRLESHVKNCIDGVGVGLTVVKKFMAIMRGQVSVESKLGSGTCFTLEFEKWVD